MKKGRQTKVLLVVVGAEKVGSENFLSKNTAAQSTGTGCAGLLLA